MACKKEVRTEKRWLEDAEGTCKKCRRDTWNPQKCNDDDDDDYDSNDDDDDDDDAKLLMLL